MEAAASMGSVVREKGKEMGYVTYKTIEQFPA